MATYETGSHWRAATSEEALSPGSSARGSSRSEFQFTDSDGRVFKLPQIIRAPANPDALIQGNRVTTPRDME